jgi:hypothetical protein
MCCRSGKESWPSCNYRLQTLTFDCKRIVELLTWTHKLLNRRNRNLLSFCLRSFIRVHWLEIIYFILSIVWVFVCFTYYALVPNKISYRLELLKSFCVVRGHCFPSCWLELEWGEESVALLLWLKLIELHARLFKFSLKMIVLSTLFAFFNNNLAHKAPNSLD